MRMRGQHVGPLRAAETALVGREDRAVTARNPYPYFVIGYRGRRMPVEYEQQVAVRKGHRLILGVHL